MSLVGSNPLIDCQLGAVTCLRAAASGCGFHTETYPARGSQIHLQLPAGLQKFFSRDLIPEVLIIRP
jgi:hypothetical protein